MNAVIIGPCNPRNPRALAKRGG